MFYFCIYLHNISHHALTISFGDHFIVMVKQLKIMEGNIEESNYDL